MEKEKDIAFLKYNLQELKTNFQGKQEEVDSLKAENVNIENEVVKMHDQNNELKKQFEIKMENLALKNELLEKKVDSFEKQMLVSKKSFEDKTLFNDNINVEIGTLKVTNINIENEMELMKDQNDELRIHVERKNNDLKNINQLLEAKLDSLGNQLVVEKQLLCNNQSEIINVKTQVGEMEKNLIENMKSSQKRRDINNAMEKVDNLKGHVTNIENILFCDSSNGCTDILIQWKLQNYQYHFDIGKPVFSPIFLTQIKGYCFKLFVEWSGENKKDLGLFLKLCHASNYDKPLEPFRMPYSLEMVDNNGNILSKKIPLSHIESQEEFFTLPPGKYECKGGWGFPIFLSMPCLNNYILNDMLSIKCRLTPL